MKLTKRELQAALDALAKANSRAHIERAKIAEHCVEVYGVDPADIDNDEFLDKCDGGCGVPTGMTAEDFDRSMLESMAMAGIEVPNVQIEGQPAVGLSRSNAGLGLLPCPFCGWAAEYGIVDGDNGHPDIGAHFIGCTNDLCAVSTAIIFPCGDDPQTLLVEKWNRRRPPLGQQPGTAIARVVESDDFSAEVAWILNPLPSGTLLYEGPNA